MPHNQDPCAQPTLLHPDQALEQLLAQVEATQDTELVTLNHAINRILAEDLSSSIDLPPFDEIPTLAPDVEWEESDAEVPVLPTDAGNLGDNDSDRLIAAICSNFLMPLSMQIAGACHLLHSVSKESFEGLEHWSIGTFSGINSKYWIVC